MDKHLDPSLTVPLLDHSADRSGHFLSKQPRLPALRHVCRVAAEKRLQGAGLVPTHQQLWIWILNKPTNIGYNTEDTGGHERSQHEGFVRAARTAPHSPPQNTTPATLRDKSIGIEIFRYSHVATLSPVHIAPAQQTHSVRFTRGQLQHF